MTWQIFKRLLWKVWYEDWLKWASVLAVFISINTVFYSVSYYVFYYLLILLILIFPQDRYEKDTVLFKQCLAPQSVICVPSFISLALMSVSVAYLGIRCLTGTDITHSPVVYWLAYGYTILIVSILYALQYYTNTIISYAATGATILYAISIIEAHQKVIQNIVLGNSLGLLLLCWLFGIPLILSMIKRNNSTIMQYIVNIIVILLVIAAVAYCNTLS